MLAGMLRAGNCAVQTANGFEVVCGYLSGGQSPDVICERSLLWAEVLNLGGYDVLAQPFDELEVRRVVALAGGPPETFS